MRAARSRLVQAALRYGADEDRALSVRGWGDNPVNRARGQHRDQEQDREAGDRVWPMHQLVKGLPSNVDEAQSAATQERMAVLASFPEEGRAVRAAPRPERMRHARALVAPPPQRSAIKPRRFRTQFSCAEGAARTSGSSPALAAGSGAASATPADTTTRTNASRLAPRPHYAELRPRYSETWTLRVAPLFTAREGGTRLPILPAAGCAQYPGWGDRSAAISWRMSHRPRAVTGGPGELRSWPLQTAP